MMAVWARNYKLGSNLLLEDGTKIPIHASTTLSGQIDELVSNIMTYDIDTLVVDKKTMALEPVVKNALRMGKYSNIMKFHMEDNG